MYARRPKPRRLSLPRDRLTISLLVGFVLIGIVTAIVGYNFVRNLVAGWSMTNLPGVHIPTPNNNNTGTGLTTPNGTSQVVVPTSPLQSENGPTPVAWDGTGRVNILLMGLDYDWETGGSNAQRTDTLILLTMDPVSQTAGMLSIPRDMWVNIPGFGYGKINTAYALGQEWNLPGGGPGLTMKTVENLLGVPINYYAQIDFQAFISFIDDIKGVKITVTEEMTVGLQEKDRKTTLEPGTYVLNGETALAYARYRYAAGDDFGRSSRQMQVIMAVRDRILQFNMLPNLVMNAPSIYNDLSSGIHTNLTLEQIIVLAWTASSIQKENIKQEVIGVNDTQSATSSDGLDILLPIPDKIRLLTDDIFATTGSASSTVVVGDPVQLMAAENATVSVENGTGTTSLAEQTTDYLKSQGMNATVGQNAKQTTYTIIIDYSGKPYTLAYLAKLMNVPSSHIVSQYDPNATVDVVIQLGSDWAQTNPMK